MELNPRIKDVLDLLDPPPGFTPWHGGPSLAGCLRGVDAIQAAWKPAPKRNSIWQLVLHMAYWKYSIIRHLKTDTVKKFERTPADFPAVPAQHSEKDWKTDKDLLKQTHETLVKEIKLFPAEELDAIVPSKTDYTYAQLITGIAAHDAYHIAQIQLLKRLYDEVGEG